MSRRAWQRLSRTASGRVLTSAAGLKSAAGWPLAVKWLPSVVGSRTDALPTPGPPRVWLEAVDDATLDDIDLAGARFRDEADALEARLWGPSGTKSGTKSPTAADAEATEEAAEVHG